METIFVQWVMGQLLIVKVRIPEKYYVEIEVIYPYLGTKGEYFTNDDDLHDENNFWIIKNLIFRVSQGYFYFSRFASDSLHDKAVFLNHESNERSYHRFVWKSIDEEVRFEWWAEDDMKFFSKRTIEEITIALKHFLNTKQSYIPDIYEFEDRDITLRKMRNIIVEQNCDDVYVYLCDRRNGAEIKNYHKKIECRNNFNFAHQVEVAITESSYSYPDMCLTTESMLLREEFEKFTDLEKEFYLSRHHVKGKWLPYNDLAKQWSDVKNGINIKNAR